MVIEEVESEEEEEIEDVDVEKPFVNGHSVQKEIPNPASDSISMDESPSSQESNSVHVNQQESSNSVQKSLSALSSQDVVDSQISGSENDTQVQCSSPKESQTAPSSEAILSSSVCSSALSSTAENLSLPSPSSSSSQNTVVPSNPPRPPPEPSEPSPPEPVNEPNPDRFSRPRFIQKSLPPEVQKLKDDGNRLFRSGQYADAIERYSRAVCNLMKGEDIIDELSKISNFMEVKKLWKLHRFIFP